MTKDRLATGSRLTTDEGVTTAEVADLLADREPDSRREVALRRALTGPDQLLLRYVKERVAAADTEALTILQQEETELHALLGQSWDGGPGPHLDQRRPFRPRETPVVHAVRALASLGLALAWSTENRAAWHLDAALHWLERAHIVPPAPPALHDTAGTSVATTGRCPENQPAARAAALLHGHGRGGHPLAPVAHVWLAEVAGAPAGRLRAVETDVLLARVGVGTRATLSAVLRRDLPPALIPDPARMCLFSADEEFAAGLATAWKLAGKGIRGAVLWSVTDRRGPVSQIGGNSLTAPTCALLDELRRTRSNRTRLFTVFRLTARTAITGHVDPADDKLLSVGGYEAKLTAASGRLERVIVPRPDEETAKRYAVGTELDICGEDTWRKAVRQARKPQTKRTLSLCLAAAIVVGGVGTGSFKYLRDDQVVRAAQARTLLKAEEVADLAGTLHAGDTDGLGLLLAMVSDDLAAGEGEQTQVLYRLARDYADLVTVLRPDGAAYDRVALSPDGQYGLIGAGDGTARLIETTKGQTLWRLDQPPGERPHLARARINSLVFSPDGSRAAVASSDRTVLVLGREQRRWSVQAALSVPGPGSGIVGPLNLMAFSPDGERLVAHDRRDQLLLHYDLDQPDAEPRRCTAPDGVQAIAVDDERSLLVVDQSIIEVRHADCGTQGVLTHPDRAVWRNVVIAPDGSVFAFATRGTQLLALGPESAPVVLSDRGPYHEVTAMATEHGVFASARNVHGTHGWDVRENSRIFGYRSPGVALVAGRGNGLWLHDGVVEIRSAQHTPALVHHTEFAYGFDVRWAAGSDLVVRTPTALFTAPYREAALHPGEGRRIDAPEGFELLTGFVTHPQKPWAAARAQDQATKERSVFVWNTSSGAPLDLPGLADPRGMVFGESTFFVALGNGDLLRFELRRGSWVRTGRIGLPEPALALAVPPEGADPDGTGVLYALLGESSRAAPAVARIDPATMEVTHTAPPLTGAAELAWITVLEDTQVVVAYGIGRVAFLSRDLEFRGDYRDPALAPVTGVADMPGLGQLMVTSRNGAVVLDRTSRARLSSPWAADGVFFSAQASPDGELLATNSYHRHEIALWSLSPVDLRAHVCEMLGRDITPEEWETHVGQDYPYRPVCAS